MKIVATLLLACAMTWNVFVNPAIADDVQIGDLENGRIKSAACAGCHMVDGNTVNPEWPKIAGQVQNYLVKQMVGFRDGDRENEIMDPFIKPLSQVDIEDIATYYSNQKMKPGIADQTQLALGEKIYRKGVFYSPLTACTGCHGNKGQGNHDWEVVMAAPPSVLAPALGGQNAPYVVKQLLAFRSGERGNDVGEVMQKIARQMSDEQIKAVAQYITQLQ